MKIGDKYRKQHWYSKDQYCKYGGDEHDIPIGSIGKVVDIQGDKIKLQFNDGVTWSVDRSEIRPYDKVAFTLQEVLNDVVKDLGGDRHDTD